MAVRPVFVTTDKFPYYKTYDIDFKYFNGFSVSQKQKSIQSLHNAFLNKFPEEKILEISTKSEVELGYQLSAFNLTIENKKHDKFSVEMAFQASKVFENGGPYLDILNKNSRDAKRDERLRNSGKLIYFQYGKRRFELIPCTYFYNWLYINTLNLYQDLCDKITDYTAFTDIEFNPQKSVNCQAHAAAIFVSLKKSNMLEAALRDRESFLKIVYGTEINSIDYKQLTISDE